MTSLRLFARPTCITMIHARAIAQRKIVQDSSRNRFSMKGYTARKYVLAAFVLVYAAIAHWGGMTSPDREFFPVFNWSLFTHVYPVQELPELRVVSIGGKTFPEPVNFFELDTYFESARLRSIIVTKTLSRIRAAIHRQDAEEVARLRKIIESRHLAGHGPVEYEIRTVKYRPVDRWKNKDHVVKETLEGRFRSEGAE
jgi:hypothetical protein